MIVDIESEESENVEQTNATSQSKTVSFPSTVGVDTDDSHINYLVFNAVQPMTEGMDMRSSSLRNRRNAFIRASNTGDRSKLKENTLAYIQLYMPSLTEELGHSYEKSESGFLADVANQIGKFQSGERDFTNTDDLMSAGGSIGESALEAIKSMGAGAVKSQLAQTEGRIFGEKSTSVYQETNLRTQQFNFRLIPKDLQELKAVGKIIHYFRKYSSAKLLSDTYKDETSYNTIEVPPIWYIEERVRDKELPRYIPKFNFGPAIITNVNVNKTPEDLYKYFDKTGGDPTSVEIQLSFQELIPVYQQYWEQTDEGIL